MRPGIQVIRFGLSAALVFCLAAPAWSGGMGEPAGVSAIRFVSSPPGARFVLDGEAVQPSVPVDLSPFFGDHVVQVLLPGHEPLLLLARRLRDGWLWGRIEKEGRLGMAVDFTAEEIRDGIPGELLVDFEAVEPEGCRTESLVLLARRDLDVPPAGARELISSGSPCPAFP